MEDKTLQGEVQTRLHEGILTITFSHPAQNSLPARLLAQLAQAIEEGGNNPEAAVIVLQSGGERTFCAGASFDELIAIADLEAGKRFFMGFANVINACRRCPKFIIGRIQGKAIGGGVGLAAATDYCFATQHAEVKLSELAVGIGPFVVGPAVERKMGVSAMSQMAIHATQWFPAEWARQQGLYAEVFDKVQDMDNAILALAYTLSKSNPEAMRLLKSVFWRGTEDWDTLLAQRAEMSGTLVLSDFTRQAIQAFKDARRK